jgi:hypothetical protein
VFRMMALVKRRQHHSIIDHFAAHDSSLLRHKRWQFTRELPSKKPISSVSARDACPS